jgi:hypothetical protein
LGEVDLDLPGDDSVNGVNYVQVLKLEIEAYRCPICDSPASKFKVSDVFHFFKFWALTK